MHTSLEYEGRSYRLEVSDATVHLEGEFAGNIDLTLASSPALPLRDALHSLRLEIPDTGELVDVLGYLETGEQLELTFLSEAIRESQCVPSLVELYWGASKETRLGTIRGREAPPPPPHEQLLARAALTPDERLRANVRGVLALLGLLLLLLATLYGLFPEVREVVGRLFRG